MIEDAPWSTADSILMNVVGYPDRIEPGGLGRRGDLGDPGKERSFVDVVIRSGSEVESGGGGGGPHRSGTGCAAARAEAGAEGVGTAMALLTDGNPNNKLDLQAYESAILNVASSGKFSSDRTVTQYANEIWGIKPIAVE